MKDEKHEYIEEWIAKANNDLKNVEIVLKSNEEDIPYDTLCFHCQQAVEKYIKAYLIHANEDVIKTHNIADLLQVCAKTQKEFTQFIEKAEMLTPFAVDIRYPDDLYMPTKKDCEEAYTIAGEIKSFILKFLSENK